MNATMETAVPSVPSVPSPPSNHPAIPDSSLVRTLQPRLDGGDDGAARKINHGYSSPSLVPALSCRPWSAMSSPSATC
jgi:hypothetical protein